MPDSFSWCMMQMWGVGIHVFCFLFRSFAVRIGRSNVYVRWFSVLVFIKFYGILSYVSIFSAYFILLACQIISVFKCMTLTFWICEVQEFIAGTDRNKCKNENILLRFLYHPSASSSPRLSATASILSLAEEFPCKTLITSVRPMPPLFLMP